MKNRKSLCIIALMLSILLAMGGCKQAEAKETSIQPVEQVEETEETTEEPTIGESTEEELKAEAEAKAKAEAEAAAKAEAEKKAAEEAAAKAEAEKKAAEELKAKEAAEAAAKAEAEKKAAEEAAAKAEAERKAAEEAAKKEQETQQSSKPDSSQSQTSTPESKPAESEPDTNTSTSSGGYTLNEYGNPVDEMAVRNGLVDTVNVSDPRFNKVCADSGYHGSTPIPNPFATVESISPFIGMKNPPADWPNPGKYTTDAGEYKWDSETGCWRYYNDLGEATRWYISLYGQKTTRSSEMKKYLGAEYKDYPANCRGVY